MCKLLTGILIPIWRMTGFHQLIWHPLANRTKNFNVFDHIVESISPFSRDRHMKDCRKKPDNNKQCFICKKTFNRHTHLRRHMEIHSNGKVRYRRCNKCRKGFRRVDLLQQHERDCNASVVVTSGSFVASMVPGALSNRHNVLANTNVMNDDELQSFAEELPSFTVDEN